MFNFSDFIYNQEAQGQQEFVNSTALPKDGDWAALAAMGVVRGEEVDNLFCEAVLPNGWKKIGGSDHQWSTLVDEKMRIKADIFYKSSFHDRKAFFKIR